MDAPSPYRSVVPVAAPRAVTKCVHLFIDIGKGRGVTVFGRLQEGIEDAGNMNSGVQGTR